MMLNNILKPSDIKKLSIEELNDLALEIKLFLIESIEQTGGHLSSNLGTIELTLAMHYVFDTPNDTFVWDVGHQAYTHKILTGRRDLMSTLRQKDGLSGFTKRSESEHDAFGAGHSSTSISAALGIAIANKLQQKSDTSIAVIGDGALSGGMSFEAMNHAGDTNVNLLIILNDNDMSISQNVGALSKYLTRLISGKIYSTMKSKSLEFLERLPRVQKFAKRSEEHLKGMFLPGTLFEELGIEYFGPIDGHDIPALIKALQNLKNIENPRILHIITKKGHGLEAAEQNPLKFHGISPPSSSSNNFPSYSKVFGEWLCNSAQNDERVIGITPAMSEGSGMVNFEKNFPERFIDVAIAEQHAVTLAGGMATKGLKPVVAIYSTFLQRGYDQFIHDIALQNLNVIFAIDRAGLVGADGATHAGIFDLSFLRCIPNIVIMAPSSSIEMYKALNFSLEFDGPVCVRFPRGKSAIEEFVTDQSLEIGKGKIVRTGKDIAIFAFGNMLEPSLRASEKINATVIDMRFVKPLDENLIIDTANSYKKLISIEDNTASGGAGSSINELLQSKNIKTRLHILGVPDLVTEHGSQDELYLLYGLHEENIINVAKN
ncbi:MAG: 1-deoxy-D-xylulose-5-phosphate synthase [Gammaproteobacteria bacterium]|nr:1-deoxy-D-xylulose-5-phosphate synthase [Gammaproteobacteria bacterium]MBT4245512.1 1-deoxy-D-xylulose-5-phosphate synthase [Gammaproteobacteria bacterium]MBT5978952.1 1-deoxy-D-xylulose-5-phosphate synthase [Gammaproteobacteria bacterium]